MSQVFQADAVMNTAGVTLTNGVAVQGALGNALNPPFGNCKAYIRGTCFFTLGSVPTNIQAQIFRNPTGENVLIASSGLLTLGVAAGVLGEVTIEGTDQIPDGRPVQYAIVITANGSGTNGTQQRAVIFAQLISG